VVVAVPGEPPPEVWEWAVAVGAENVVSLPQAEAWLVAAFAEAAEGARGVGAVLGVVGGRGGAGASVLAAAVALRAAQDGGRAMLVDCDPLGGGLDLVLGAEATEGARWPELAIAGGRVPATALHAALPRAGRGGGSLAVLSCDRSDQGPSAAGVNTVLDAGRRGGETVVCDLPRYPTDAALAALSAADLTVLVVPADVRSCASAGRVAAVLAEQARAVRLVVRGPAPGGITPDEIARTLGLPLLAAMRPQPGLRAMLERGTPPDRGRGPLAEAARAVLTELHALAGLTAGWPA
jgi:secretion/DNA translocation related CpaE-like protein